MRVGQRLPKPEWLKPTAEDEAEGGRAGRPAGLSVWEASRTRVVDAMWFRGEAAEQEAFAAIVSAVTTLGKGHGRELAVVCDAHPFAEDDGRWSELDGPSQVRLRCAAEGHALIEGLARPPGAPRGPYAAFLAALITVFDPYAE